MISRPAPSIHPTAIIESGAELGQNVFVGANVFIGSKAVIGDGCVVLHGACVYGKTTLGRDNKLFSYAVIGSEPQDLKFKGEETELIIGDGNTIREFTLFNPGTEGGGGKTVIGNNNLFMGYVHVAHDCIIGDRCIIANAVTIAGHVSVGSNAFIGGMCGIHQFVTIGEHSAIAAMSALSQDVPPFCMAEGNRAKLRGLNINGLRRRLDREEIDKIKSAYKELFSGVRPMKEAALEIKNSSSFESVKLLCEFVLNTKRGIPVSRDATGEEETI